MELSEIRFRITEAVTVLPRWVERDGALYKLAFDSLPPSMTITPESSPEEIKAEIERAAIIGGTNLGNVEIMPEEQDKQLKNTQEYHQEHKLEDIEAAAAAHPSSETPGTEANAPAGSGTTVDGDPVNLELQQQQEEEKQEEHPQERQE